MALAEFQPSREKAIQEVNSFLKEHYSVDSFRDIMPAILLQFSSPEGNPHAYPLVSVEPRGPEWNNYWSGRVPKEISHESCIIQKGAELQWKVKVPSETFQIKKISFLERFFRNKPAKSLGVPEFAYTRLGRLTDIYTEEKKELHLIDFAYKGGTASFNDLDRFKAANWLYAAFKEGKVTCPEKKPSPSG